MEYLKLFFLSMIPIIELRGAIPLGIAMDLKPIYIYITCVIGSSIISVPVVLLFRQVIDYLRHRKYFNKLIRWVDKKIQGRAKKLKAASILGLIIFVGVPFPTTGSWSGSALASIFKMRLKDSLLGIFIGNAIAGVLILTVSMHVADGVSIELLLMALIAMAVVFYVVKKKKKSGDNEIKVTN
ncbi:COG2426 family protein [Intestinibacter sp.]